MKKPNNRHGRRSETETSMCISLPKEMKAKIKERAKEEDLSVAQVIRRCIREHLIDKEENGTYAAQKKEAAG